VRSGSWRGFGELIGGVVDLVVDVRLWAFPFVAVDEMVCCWRSWIRFAEVVVMNQEIVHTCNGVAFGSEMAVYTLPPCGHRAL